MALLAEQVNPHALGNGVGFASANLICSVVHRSVPSSLQAARLAEPREEGGFAAALLSALHELGSSGSRLGPTRAFSQ